MKNVFLTCPKIRKRREFFHKLHLPFYDFFCSFKPFFSVKIKHEGSHMDSFWTSS
ncbi:hypothetical protein LEP1GSC162_3560 [Leptospira santarosai str. CBC1531]|nr:hypothetical protein LEP1GSC162_3560 [Leptospira santarosai str. CBC1531]